jgi:hypothetical protein
MSPMAFFVGHGRDLAVKPHGSAHMAEAARFVTPQCGGADCAPGIRMSIVMSAGRPPEPA